MLLYLLTLLQFVYFLEPSFSILSFLVIFKANNPEEETPGKTNSNPQKPNMAKEMVKHCFLNTSWRWQALNKSPRHAWPANTALRPITTNYSETHSYLTRSISAFIDRMQFLDFDIKGLRRQYILAAPEFY